MKPPAQPDYTLGKLRPAIGGFPFPMHRTPGEIEAGVGPTEIEVSMHRAGKTRLAKWVRSTGKARET